MGADEGGAGDIARLGLDELLGELRSRVEEVRGSRDRLNGLLEAVLSVGRGLDLPQVLRGIVEAAVVLVDAEYGALGVVGEERNLTSFLTAGVSEEDRRRIGELPSGHGLLGELIRHPETLRLAELSEHPSSAGFPAHHPPMHSFLGVPVRVRDEVFGNLYLTEKRGGGEFDAEDESVLTTLAVAAGIAIENARLFEKVRLRERWLTASADFTSALLAGSSEIEVLEMMTDRARRITSSGLGVVYLTGPGGELREALALGEKGERPPRARGRGDGGGRGPAAGAGGARTPPPEGETPGGPARRPGSGPAVAVPVGGTGRARGVLVLARRAGEPAFTEAETAPLPGFAGQAALALELEDRRRDSEQMALLADRDRIARDLHDLAIQRLFATGMTLQSARRFVEHPQATERLVRAIDDLDDTIKIIRSTIFGLRERENPQASPGLRVRTVRALEQAARTLGFAPGLRMEGLIDTDVPRPVADEVLAVLGEALTNVARHARASRAEVSLVVRTGTLTAEITDDGVGLDPSASGDGNASGGGRRGGLRNLAERAERLGGTMTTAPGETGGARLVWRVPL
ncbi:histidine kinase [Streptomyces inusitatus]|uniref:Histidine kinase n=1 Tax=Streptomyces inusitatus TaxID=68221 RepID=A0A918USD4_9ACTN|nr:GAF domain-containing protein [Streptomyces inusitatus]GGZ30061.1 histidine kinase [Streptomyces inusitatus]